MVRLAIWYSKDEKKPKLFFSNNTDMSGKDVIEYYRTRFQIEFCFRDAKSFTGLMQSQARDVSKLSFNFNASLTSVNLARVLAKERGIPFSMASCKAMTHNAYLLERFICVSGIKPNRNPHDYSNTHEHENIAVFSPFLSFFIDLYRLLSRRL